MSVTSANSATALVFSVGAAQLTRTPGEAPRAIRDDQKSATGSAFGPFRHPAFTVIWTASVVANFGTWMYTAASGWLMTNPDPLTVSLVQVAASLLIFLIAIPAGALADIVDRLPDRRRSR